MFVHVLHRFRRSPHARTAYQTQASRATIRFRSPGFACVECIRQVRRRFGGGEIAHVSHVTHVLNVLVINEARPVLIPASWATQRGNVSASTISIRIIWIGAKQNKRNTYPILFLISTLERGIRRLANSYELIVASVALGWGTSVCVCAAKQANNYYYEGLRPHSCE